MVTASREGLTVTKAKGKPTVAVLGAGNVGLAMSAFLASRNVGVNLYNAYQSEIAEIGVARTVEAEGVLTGTFHLNAVTTNIEEALTGVTTAIMTVPAFAQEAILESAAPFLGGIDAIVIHPGAVGGALAAYEQLRRLGTGDAVVLAETSTSLFSCRRQSSTRVRVRQVKQSVSAAAVPATRTNELVATLNSLFGDRFTAASSVLETSLNNINPVYHCPPMITNFGRVETQEVVPFWEVVTPGIAELVARLDEERLALARDLGIPNVRAFSEFMVESYGAQAGPLLGMIQESYSRGGGSPMPTDPQHRYLSEDVPYGLVPYLSLSEVTGTPMPIAAALVELATAMTGAPWRDTGRRFDSGKRGLAALKESVMGGS